MPIIPCCSHVLCPGGGTGPNSLEFDSPLANLSSELPDQDLFVGLNFGSDHNVPPLGSNWTKNSCLGVCTSSVSQQAADDCAARNNLTCLVNDGWGTPPGTGPTGGPSSGPPLIPAPPGKPPQLSLNLNQSCIAICPDGLPFSFTVSAGTFIARNQLLANQMAFSRACTLAFVDQICLSNLNPAMGTLNQPYTGTITIAGGLAPYSFTIIAGALPAGLFFGQSNPQTIVIFGTPTASGPFPFTLLVTDARGNFMQKTFTLTIPVTLWGKLVWDMSADNPPGVSCPTGTMVDNTAGNKANCLAISTCGNPFNGIVNAGPVGTVSYQGPSLACHVSLQMAFTNNNAVSQNGFTIFYDLGGPSQQTLVQEVNVNGNFEIDFTIPNSPNAKILSVFVTASASQNLVSAPDTVSVVATLTPA